MKLSFVVPIYRVEPYLRKCVDSLLHQDYDNYEIILVDDGSKDGCPAICDEYVELGKRLKVNGESCPDIRVVHRENGGLSAARNSGIEIAKGDYLCFVDSDDYWEENVLGTLMAQVEREHLDVLRFNYQHVNPAYEVYWPYKSPKVVDQCTDIVNGLTYLNTRMGYGCYAWQWIIRRDIVNIFRPGIHFEDTEWLPRMMLVAKRVNATTTVVYNYLLREGSITGVKNDAQRRKNLEDQLLVIESLNTALAQYPDCDWVRRMRSTMVSTVLTTIAISFFSERRNYIDRLYAQHVFPLSRNIKGKTYRRRAILINICPYLYCWIQHIFH